MLIAVLTLQPLAATAQVVSANKPGASPTVGAAPNGVPLVQIAAPNGAGVSHNQYQQFNVEPRGLILNNSRTVTNTQQAGWIEANPNLGGAAARIILNEVTGTQASQLNGSTEVAGTRAEVVIANPNGITCNGCGFINTSRALLTTGVPVFGGSGSLDAFRVTAGQITIGADGLTTPDQIDLVARGVQIAGPVWAGNLNVAAGTNQVNYADLGATPIAGTGPAPAIGIDVAVLGGMYANKIRLISTEAGVGVNSQGLMAAQNGDFQLDAQGKITLAGRTSATGNLTFNGTADIDHSGTTYAGGSVRVNSAGQTTNSGLIAAQGSLTVTASSLNSTGTLGAGIDSHGNVAQPGQLAVTASGALTAKGRNIAGGNLSLAGSQITLAGGNTQAGGNIAITTAGSLDLQNATLAASGNNTLTADTVLNGQGTLTSGQNLSVTTLQALDNRSGLIAANGTVSLSASQIDNTQGVIGSVGGDTGITARTGNLNNAGGRIEAAGAATLTGTGLDNRSGIIAANTLNLDSGAATLDNRGGQISAQQNAALQGNTLANNGGLVRAGGTLNLTAATIVNAGTQSANQGLQGQNISLAASQIDNGQGSILADDSLTITSGGSLNNTQGLVSSTGTLTVQDALPNAKTLVVNNTGGTLIAGQALSVDSATLTNSGDVLGQKDLTVKVANDLTNSGRIQAVNNASVETAGTLINQGKALAGNQLSLKAATIDNRSGGQISAPQLKLAATAPNTFINRGLIDGVDTIIEAVTVNNLGTGRIYGDHVAIGATTLTNDAEGGVAPVIAARNRLDLGITTLNNREHALLFSAGDLAIGGSLDVGKHAIGQAAAVNNASATLEAQGKLDISAQQINNTNEHFSTETVTTGSQTIQEYQVSGYADRWKPDQVYTFVAEELVLHVIPTGQESFWVGFNQYDYQRTTTESRVARSDPARILSGGGLNITAGNLLNDKSQIVAGGNLTGSIGTLTNTQATGERTTTDNGTVTNYYRIYQKGADSYGSATSGYAPAPVVESIALTAGSVQQNTAPVGTGTQVDPLTAAVLNRTPDGAGSSQAITQVANSNGSVTRTANPNVTPPNSSLYNIVPNPAGNYYVETDPRFTGYASFISSDYMLTRLGLEPAAVEKRLGDGFYEQKLINDQILQLTGRRFLGNTASNEDQYRALMDNGIAYTRQFNLAPGVALSAEQMSRLTSDIVLLVEKEVKLADGTTVKALVPQVYLKAGSFDITGDGALIAGKTVTLNLAGDLTNRGTLSGQQSLAVAAENLNNLNGRISSADSTLVARTDLANLGGIIDGADRLNIAAGRDLTVSATTSSQQNANGSRTNIASTGGLYVSNAKGTLSAVAGRDVNLDAGEISNNGQGGTTTLVAGNNLNLGTVSESSSNRIVWNGNNFRNDSSRTEVGSNIVTQGDLTLSAGADLNARAANVTSSDGALTAVAGRNLTLSSGEANVTLDEKHQSTSKGLLSKKTVTTQSTLDQTKALGSTFSGNTVTLAANEKLTVSGSTVVGSGDVALVGKSIDIDAAKETRHSSFEETKLTSGAFSTGGNGRIGVGIGKKTEGLEKDEKSVTHVGSTIGSVGGNITIAADQDLNIAGSRLQAAGNIDASGRNVTVTSLVDTIDSLEKRYVETSGLKIGARSNITDAAAKIKQSSERAQQTDDPRLKALYAARAAYVVKDIANMVETYQKSGSQGGISGRVSIGIGVSRQESESKAHAESLVRSQAAAGGNISISAVGDGTPEQGDLTVKGSDLKAANILLSATRDLKLQSQALTQTSENKTTSTNLEAGLFAGGSVGNGGGKGGIGIYGEASINKTASKLDTTTYEESRITASDTLTLKSGRDTTLQGVLASGNTVKAEAGRNLTLISEQDTQTYKSKSASAAIEGRYSIWGNDNGVDASLSYSQTDAKYRSVNEQTGLNAGTGGFDIQVGNHTQLVGAVIGSSATEDKNRLKTATFSTQDLKNEYDLKSFSVALSISSNGGGSAPGTGASPNILGGSLGQGLTPGLGVPTTEHKEGITRSAIAPGSIELTGDDDNSKQQLANLSRDTQSANAGAIKNPLDLKKLAERQEMSTLMGEIGNRAIGDLSQHLTENAVEDAKRAQEDLAKAQTPEEQQAAQQRLKDAVASYDTWKDGGTGKILLHGLVSGLQAGMAKGNINAAVLSGAANEALTPWIADQVAEVQKEKRIALEQESKRVSEMPQGAERDAAKAELDQQAQALENERKNLHQIASMTLGGLIGLASGGDASSALSGSAVALDATKNNYLKHSQIMLLMKEWQDCAKSSNQAACQNEVTAKYRGISQENDKEILACNSFACIAGHLGEINKAQSALEQLKNLDGTPQTTRLYQSVERWQSGRTSADSLFGSGSTQPSGVLAARMTAAQKGLANDLAEKTLQEVSRLCRGMSEEACSRSLLLDKQNAKIRDELIYMLLMFTPLGVADDGKSLVTGNDLRGEESSRLFALFGVMTAGEMSALKKTGKAVDKVVDIFKALNKSDELAVIAKDVAKAQDELRQVAKGGAAAESEIGATFSTSQLDKKFKHAEDFGLFTTKKNPETLAQYQQAIESHLADPSTYQHGTYQYVSGSTVYYNPATNNVVVLGKDGAFVSGWKLDVGSPQFENFIKNGVLR